MSGRILEMAGQVFGRLTVLSEAGRVHAKAMWLCSCSCGGQCTIVGDSLRLGRTKSCGCLKKESDRQNAKFLTPNRGGVLSPGYQHGLSGTPEYTAWLGARRRCAEDPDYVSRGIEFRLPSFPEFLAAIGSKPEPKNEYSIDRIDNDGHYELGNVRWATRIQQANNQHHSYRNHDEAGKFAPTQPPLEDCQ